MQSSECQVTQLIEAMAHCALDLCWYVYSLEQASMCRSHFPVLLRSGPHSCSLAENKTRIVRTQIIQWLLACKGAASADWWPVGGKLYSKRFCVHATQVSLKSCCPVKHVPRLICACVCSSSKFCAWTPYGLQTLLYYTGVPTSQPGHDMACCVACI